MEYTLQYYLWLSSKSSVNLTKYVTGGYWRWLVSVFIDMASQQTILRSVQKLNLDLSDIK